MSFDKHVPSPFGYVPNPFGIDLSSADGDVNNEDIQNPSLLGPYTPFPVEGSLFFPKADLPSSFGPSVAGNSTGLGLGQTIPQMSLLSKPAEDPRIQNLRKTPSATVTTKEKDADLSDWSMAEIEAFFSGLGYQEEVEVIRQAQFDVQQATFLKGGKITPIQNFSLKFGVKMMQLFKSMREMAEENSKPRSSARASNSTITSGNNDSGGGTTFSSSKGGFWKRGGGDSDGDRSDCNKCKGNGHNSWECPNASAQRDGNRRGTHAHASSNSDSGWGGGSVSGRGFVPRGRGRGRGHWEGSTNRESWSNVVDTMENFHQYSRGLRYPGGGRGRGRVLHPGSNDRLSSSDRQAATDNRARPSNYTVGRGTSAPRRPPLLPTPTWRPLRPALLPTPTQRPALLPTPVYTIDDDDDDDSWAKDWEGGETPLNQHSPKRPDNDSTSGGSYTIDIPHDEEDWQHNPLKRKASATVTSTLSVGASDKKMKVSVGGNAAATKSTTVETPHHDESDDWK